MKREILKQHESDALRVYHLYWASYMKGDVETFASTLDEAFEMIGTSENEVAHNKAEGLGFYKGQLHEVVGKVEMRNRSISAKPLDGMILVNEASDIYILGDHEWTFYSKLRLSTLLHETESGWKVIQQHGSLPDMRVQEGETLALEKISKENLELRDAVRRRTAELENKNRELAIEAAMEKVRAVAMGMKKPEDMLDVCRIISDQLQQFGVSKIRNVQTAVIDENIGQYLCYQYFPAYGKTTIEDTEYHKSPVEHGMVWQMLSSRDGHFTGSLSGKELEEFRSHRKEENHFPDPHLDEAKELAYCFLSIGEGGLGLTLYQPMETDVLTLFKRFHQVFSLAYQRFRDIQKAEAHARESEIDLALERVRAQTMAMHSSEDVGKCIIKMFAELTALGVDEGTRFGIGILNHDNENNQLWTARKDREEVKMHIGNLDMSWHPLLISARKAWLGQIPFHKYELEGEDLLNFYRMLNTAPDYKIRIPIEKLPKKEIQHCFIFEHGFFYAFSPQEFQPELIHITKRFSSQFAQTYRRYLDLVKAEAQVREAEIELALERVRARTMAMHHTEELKEVIQVVFDQFVGLNIHVDHAGFFLDYKERDDMHIWLADHHQGVPSEITIPYFDSPHWNSFLEARAKGDSFFSNLLDFEAKNNFYKDLFQWIPELTEEAQQAIFSKPGLAISTVLLDNVGLYIEHYSEISFIAEENKILIRLGKVFQQTYTRFLDLQKAEAQAREAQIEAALERIRAKAMAMHHSGELKDVLTVLFNQFDILGIKPVQAQLSLFDLENNRFSFRSTGKGGRGNMGDQVIDMDAMDTWKETIDTWRASKPKSISTVYFPKETLPQLWALFDELTNQLPEEDIITQEDYPDGVYVTEGNFNYGYIGFSHHRKATPEEEDIVIKIATEFGRLYQRFLDLQKAEAQAREAQIQLSLERIRAKAMAMQHSDELSGFLTVLFEQFKVLNLNPVNCHLNFLDIENNRNIFRITGKRGAALIATQEIDLDASPLWKKRKEDWKAGHPNDVDVLYVPYENHQEINAIFEELLSKLPKEDRPLPEDFPDGLYVIDGYCRYGYLGYCASKPPFDEEKEITRRIAHEFGNVYQRFLDLEKAEAQAREAQIQLSLERIRAKAMSIQHSDELSDFLTVVFEQFHVLNLRPVNSQLSFLDIDNNRSIFRLTGKNGATLIATQEVDLDASPIWKQKVEDFKSGQSNDVDVLFVPYDMLPEIGEIFKEILAKLPEDERPLPEDYPNGQFIVEGIFKYGYLGYSASRPPSDEEKEITRRIANEFGNVYQRFLDLQKAEAQARESQIQLAMERVRARTMAMQHSSELGETSALLFQQIQSLGVPPWSCGFNIWDQGDTVFTSYMGSPDGAILDGFKIPITEEATFIHFQESRDRGDKLFVDVLEGETLKAHYRYFLSLPEIKKAFEKRAQAGEHHPTFQINHLANFSHGNLMFITYEPCPQAHDIFIRFAKVFEQTYTRFLDLQKAEAQARESQIEAALERVRSRSMAMHKSEELADLSLELVKQVQTLGMESWFCAFNIYDDDPRGSVEWGSNGQGTFPQYRTPREGVFLRYFEAGQRGETLLVNEIGEEECTAHYEYLCSLPGVGEQLLQMMVAGIPFPTSQIDHVAFFKYGYVLFITYEPAPESHHIFKRFAKVFEQTYTRFLDIQKAEEQAREAQIENALEKVRSRTMAMQRSDELTDVAGLLFNQVSALGIILWTAGFNVWSEDNNSYVDYLSLNGEFYEPYTVHTEKAEALKDLSNIRKSGVEFDILYVEGEKIKQLYLALSGIDEKEYDIMVKDGLLPFQQYEHFVFGAKVSVMFITYEPVPEAHDIFKRLGKVFEQTYTRFLDLQKAETQAREAKIETSLEKVRSRTMGMQSSEELPEVANLLFTEVRALGIYAWSCGYNILAEDKKTATCCMSSEGTLQTPFQLRLWGENSFDEMGEFVLSDHTMLVQELGDKALEGHYAHMKSFPDLKPTFDEIDRLGLSLPTYQINHLCKFNGGFILFITYEKVPESHAIFKRFTNVFDQTYTRFLDLKKAEAQAREAQIENALEKVRSRSLAMQSPDELIEVAQLLREEMGALGVEELETSSIYIHDESNGTTQCWFTIKKSDNLGNAVTDQMILDLNDTWVGRKMVDFYQSDANQTSILMQGVNRIEWIHYCEEKSDLFGKSNFYGQTIPDRTYHLYKFSNGFVGAASTGPISEESWDLLRRATAVFSFAFTRFQDLQMAQSSARTALIQASLDRVRADISSMRNTADLDRVTPLIFHELTTLGIPFIRCGVFIIREKEEIVEAYLSSPDGNSLGVLRLPYHASDLTFQTVVAWRKGEVYRQHWNKEDFVRWINQLMDQDQIQDSRTYQGAASPPESLDLQFVPFTQGMLYVGSTAPLGEGEIDLVRALAKAFAIAYARYEDFVKLDKAKAEIESALTELKATQAQLIQQEKLASLGQLTAGIAHEIKNPLNFVNNFSEVSIEMIEEIIEERAKSQESRDESLIDEILDDIKSNLLKVHEHGTRANGIVSSMLQHSREGSGKKEPTNLNALIREYSNLAFHGMRAGKNPINAEIDLQLDSQIINVPLIGEDFSRVLLNLCNNAFDAMRATAQIRPPKLTIRTKLQAEKILIEVEDNGPGIPDEIKDKILQPFFTTKKGTEGTGLGLSITHDIIKAHGGELEIETAINIGTKFIIKLSK